MTINEGMRLIEHLNKDIADGIDVEFNKQWISILEKEVKKATDEALMMICEWLDEADDDLEWSINEYNYNNQN